VDDLLKKYREGFYTYWGIIPKELGIVIGIIGLIRLDWELRSAEVGFVLGKRFQGVGFMTEACHAVLSFGFEEMGLEWIEAKCRPVNKASERLLTKVGMQRIGNLCTLYPKRDREELVLYSIPQAAWNRKR
jgi:RimJ/RimL family protein N-acetyltransferase